MGESFTQKLFKRCMWCDNEALFECDQMLGMKATVGPKQSVVYAPIAEQETYTCDALMCLHHRRISGFYCAGKDSSTIDCCPYCATTPPDCKPMLKEEAEELRRKRHAEIRRSQFKAA